MQTLTSTLVATFGSLLLAAHASADVIFSQTPAAIDRGGVTSDRAAEPNGNQGADDVTLSTTQTARSVTWRGFFTSREPVATPLAFQLLFYADDNGVPDTTIAPLSTTLVPIASTNQFIDTGIDVGDSDVFPFSANLNPIELQANETVWFSVLAQTRDDAPGRFAWTLPFTDEPTAVRSDVTNNAPFSRTAGGPYYFVLDNTPIPEPTSLGLLGLGGLALLSRRSPRRS